MNDRVTAPKRLRRDHPPDFKRQLVARAMAPGASVSAIALEAGINANLLFTWRRAHRDSMAGTADPVLLPVTIETPGSQDSAEVGTESIGVEGAIEIELAGARVRLSGTVDEASLRCVLQTLHALA